MAAGHERGADIAGEGRINTPTHGPGYVRRLTAALLRLIGLIAVAAGLRIWANLTSLPYRHNLPRWYNPDLALGFHNQSIPSFRFLQPELVGSIR